VKYGRKKIQYRVGRGLVMKATIKQRGNTITNKKRLELQQNE
jgi:hypothetical protein